jgi:hypothetical protein
MSWLGDEEATATKIAEYEVRIAAFGIPIGELTTEMDLKKYPDCPCR